MANPIPPPDPATSLTAAELRRRLLASTPPPLAAIASTSEAGETAEELPEAEQVETPPTWAPNSQQELLARLKMPGKSGPVSVPAPRPTPVVPVPPAQTPTRTPVNRRTPLPGGRPDPASAIAGALHQLAGYDNHNRYGHDDSHHSDIQRLKAENKELRTLLDEMKHLLQEASETEQQLVIKEKEFEAALSAKDTQIDELSAQLGAIEDQIARGELAPPPPVPKTRSELEEWADELEKEAAKLQQERKKLDAERQQFREDEEALEKQMREMEVAMARERALIARQETELRRLSAEIQHELELMQRGDANLREQMSKFQRRAQEVLTKPPAGGGRR